MKWIGQHIWDLISRFRGDVYLENVSESTQDHVVGIDANGKLYKQDVSSGDITAVTITTDSGGGSAASDTSGSADFSILGSNGVGVTNSGTTITATAVPGEIDHDSLNNFLAAEHVDWAGASAGTIHSTNIPTLNQNTTGTAANLTASTSTAVQLGTIELGHASDTTIARSDSGVAMVESKIIQTKDKVIHLEHANFSDNMATTEHFVPFVTTAESSNFANIVTPMIMPTGGKLLKVHLKSNNHWNNSSNEVTFKLYRVPDGSLWSEGNKAVLGTKVIDGVARTAAHTADFTDLTTSGASGTNAFSASDMIGVSVQNSQAQGTTDKISVTMVFELDFNSY
tara:strand:- start:323 stop:1342 length:1020 start_codon:yes stop_codon:yes gene_type:complete